MSSDTDTTEKKALIAVTAFIVAFLALFVLKINGFFDFTHRFGIREISATLDQDNVMLMIDGDTETIWADATFISDTVAEPGDSITITFDKKRDVSGVEFTGTTPDRLGFMYATSDEPDAWQDIDVSVGADGRYDFSSPVETDRIRIEAAEGGKEYKWRVAELSVLD